MRSIGKNKNKGFTLAELLIVITIIGVLIAFIIPAIANKIEKSREAVDIANVRSAYAEIMSNVVTENDSDSSRIVKLKQKKDDWQTDPVTIAGITHHKGDTDNVNWKGIPVANGECEITYDKTNGICFYWKNSGGSEGGGGSSSTSPNINFKVNDLHGALDNTNLMNNLATAGNIRFEIDSKCPSSSMLGQVEEQIGDDSLLKYGTWAYLGSTTENTKRYLFWTSVDTNKVGAGNKIPIIVSKGGGGYYIAESKTAERTDKNGNIYVAIADHIYNEYGFSSYTKGKRYDSLDDAYAAYTKLITDGAYNKYKDTLPVKK